MALREIKVGDVVIVQQCSFGRGHGHEGNRGTVTAVDEHRWVEVKMDAGDYCEPRDFVHAPK